MVLEIYYVWVFYTNHLCIFNHKLLFQISEWMYFQKYGVSFIEQFSLNYISPWIGGGNDNNQQVPGINIQHSIFY